MARTFGSLVLGLALALACSTCSSAEEARLIVEFHHQLGGQPLVLDETRVTRYGQTVRFDHLRYWVSHVRVSDGASGYQQAIPDSYYLIEQTPDRTRLELSFELPAGQFDALELHIGVDPEPNARLDAAAGELLAGIGMDWSWDTGYKFFRAEGELPEIDERFVIHVGGDLLYKRLRAELGRPIALERGQTTTIVLEADVDRLFAGVDLSASLQALGGPIDSLSGKLAGNYSRMFTLVVGSERVAMQPSSPNLIDEGDNELPTDGTPPTLSEAPIDLEALRCDPVPGRPLEHERACFSAFELEATPLGMFTAITQASATVVAAAPGVVSEVRFTEHDDQTHTDRFRVTVRPNLDSAFFLEYHELEQPLVAVGDVVEAGDPLGRASGYWHPDFGATRFAVVRRQELVQRLCPTRYASAELSSQFEQALAQASAAWPEHAAEQLCVAASLVCASEPCESADDFVIAHGDVDAGRRLYASGCAGCHGSQGQGEIGGPLCSGETCECSDCIDHATLAARIALDMPPEGSCEGQCAADVAAFILHELALP